MENIAVRIFKEMTRMAVHKNSDEIWEGLTNRAKELSIIKENTESRELVDLAEEFVGKKLNFLKEPYNKYKTVTIDILKQYNEKLIRATCSGIRGGKYSYIEVRELKDYPKIPPLRCLREVKSASTHFNRFVVAYPVTGTVKELDPIIFGVLPRDTNLYFITEWDNDLSFEDIKRGNI